MNGLANMTPGMRSPFLGAGGSIPPHMQPGMNVTGQGIDPHMAAMYRQQQAAAMFQQQMQQQQQMNPYAGGIPPHLRVMQQSQQQSSPSFNGLTNGGVGPMQQPGGMQQWPNMMQINGQTNGHPRGFDNPSSMDIQNSKFFK